MALICICGCNVQKDGLKQKLASVGAKYHCDEFDDFCWVRIQDEGAVSNVLQTVNDSGAPVNAVYVNGLSISCDDIKAIGKVKGAIELDLSNGKLPTCRFLVNNVWKLSVNNASFQWESLKAFKAIRVLSIDADRINEEAIDSLNEMESVQQISLSYGSSYDFDIAVLTGLKYVTSVNLISNQAAFNDSNVIALQKRFRIGINGHWRNQGMEKRGTLRVGSDGGIRVSSDRVSRN